MRVKGRVSIRVRVRGYRLIRMFVNGFLFNHFEIHDPRLPNLLHLQCTVKSIRTLP